jgi:hypothetical protein
VTNINPGDQRRSRPGASSLRFGFPGTSVPGAGSGTGLRAAAMRPVPRLRNKAALAIPAPQLGQTNNYNHMTSVYAVGEGAQGPPHRRGPT